MGQILKVDTSNQDLLKKREYKVPTPGTYTLEVANDLKVTDAKHSSNQVVNIELRILDDGEFKGSRIFDNLVISADPAVRAKCEWKTAQFAVACGVVSPDDIKNIGEIDLGEFKGRTCKAVTDIDTSTFTNAAGEPQTRKKAVIKQYLFETSS